MAGENFGAGSYGFGKGTEIMCFEGDVDLSVSQNGANYPYQISGGQNFGAMGKFALINSFKSRIGNNSSKSLSFLHLKNDLCFLSSCSELLAGDNMGTGSHNFEKRTGIMGLEGDADLRDPQNGENYPCQISVRKILKRRVSLCFNQHSQLSLR